MGRTVLLVAIGLLAIGGTLAEDKKVNSSVTVDQGVLDQDSSVKQDKDVKDHEFAESAPKQRLYKKSPEPRVYASSAPHTHYSYKVFPAVPQNSHKGGPVKASSVVVPKVLQFDLRDSYGKYVESPQTAAYKPSYPQQFVRLQDLPPHLAQPLVSAASPSFQFRATPNYFFGPQSYQVPELQLTGPSGNQMGRFTEPLVYAEDIKNLAPQTIFHLPSVIQHATNSLQESKNSPNYQPLHKQHKKSAPPKKSNIRYRPQDVKYHSSRELAQHLQEAEPTKVSTVVNGKQTLVKVETKPVLPLLDLNLLEPLKFDNPLVPQIQHFLPKISEATYHKLPAYNPKKDPNDYTVTKVKSYDTTPKKQHKPPKSGITVKGHPNNGDYSYEINSPNHRETYNEQVLKYNKETNTQPVEFVYNEQSKKEPEIYAYVHHSKEPLKVTHVEYNNDQNDFNMQSQEEQVNKDDPSLPSSQESSADSEEYSSASEEEDEQSHAEESPQDPQTHYHSEHLETPNHSQNYEQKRHQEPPAPKQQQTITYLLPTQEYQAKDGQQGQTEKFSPQPQYYIKMQPLPPTKATNQQNNNRNLYKNLDYEINQGVSQMPNQEGSFHGVPIASHQLKVEHREQQQQYQQKPNYGMNQEVIQTTPRYFSQPVVVQNKFQPVHPLDIRVVPTNTPRALPIKVDPNQHIQPRPQPVIMSASPAPQKMAPQNFNTPTFKPIPHDNPGPSTYGQAKRIYIKQDEETPDKKHKHTEHIMAEMIDQMENSEEEFEKAYKEAAFGFPAYKQIEEDVEKDIYNPESYGRPLEFSLDEPIFKEFQKQGDKLTKSARQSYKTIKDNNHEDYYTDFAIHRPESFTDRVKNRVEYYKMFKQNRPHKGNSEKLIISPYFDHKGKSEKLILSPSFDYKGKSEKLILSPSFDHFETSPSPRLKVKQNKSPESAQYKLAPTVKYEYQYEYEPPKDSIAFASSRPYHKYRTQFVEPQFQYGFEPLIYAPIAAESEMAAVASNRSPESEKPGSSKKLYKEKWYLKKTTTRSKSKPS